MVLYIINRVNNFATKNMRFLVLIIGGETRASQDLLGWKECILQAK